MDLVHRLRLRFRGRAPLGAENPQRLDLTISGLRDGVSATEHRQSGLVGIDRIRLATQPASLPVLPNDLDDGEAGGREFPCDAGAVGSSSLNPDAVDMAVRVEEVDDLRIAAAGRRELAVCDGTAEVINDGDVMGVLMRIDPCDQPARHERIG